jgi:[acyl-carrier-protein] S-malonyltransferase
MPIDLAAAVADTAFALRGYNITNLGRTREFLDHPAYAPTMERYLRAAGELCADVTWQPVDLIRRVRAHEEAGLDAYAEAIALVAAVELAQLQMLSEFHGVQFADGRLAFGYSLGEITAIVAGGVFEFAEAIRVPLAMAADCAALAADVTLGVLFSRGPVIDEVEVQRLCLQISSAGDGTVGLSAILSPNTFLVVGQRNTMQRFKATMHDVLPMPAHLRLNQHRWPPLHTPIIRQANVPDRASVMLSAARGGLTPPCPPVLSLATGEESYDDLSARDIIRRWIDHPQRLWDAVYGTLARGVKTVVHVGPAPNVIPATFHRLAANVSEQTSGRSLGSLGLKAVSGMARRPWLATLLPSRTALLRAPAVRQVVLEDWLLDADVD